MENNLFDAIEEIDATPMDPSIDLSGLTNRKKERKEKFGSILACISLFLVLLAIVYYYLGDPFHILGILPQNYEQKMVQEIAPLGAVDVYILSLGNADCVVFEADKKSHMMVDAGAIGDYQTIDSFLRTHNVDKLDVLIATHADDAHTGAMLAVMQDYSPDVFVYPAVYPSDSALADCVTYASDHSMTQLAIGILPSDSGPANISWAEDTEVLCLSPFSGNYSDENDYSIILHLKYGETSMILSGDASAAAERIAVKMLPNHYFHSNIVMLGNHGGNNASCEKYLDVIKATIAAVSCNQDGPHKEVISRVKLKGMNLYRTDRDGTIHLRLDGVNASVVE